MYERPDLDMISEKFEILLEDFRQAQRVEEQNDILTNINDIRNNVETMFSLVQIRHSIDTEDEFYEIENNFMDEKQPKYEKLIFTFYKELVASKFRNELQAIWGEQLFNLAELQIQTFSEDIMNDLVIENKLITEYNKLIASAKLEFEGETNYYNKSLLFLFNRIHVSVYYFFSMILFSGKN